MGWRIDDDVQQLLRESARGYLDDQSGPLHLRKVSEAGEGFDPAAWKAMAELGWTGIMLPESAGGSELGLGPALTLAEEIGRSLSPEPFTAAAIIAATLLAEAVRAGGEPHPSITALAAGEEVVTLAWQETRNAVIMPERFETVLAGDRLTGRKLFVPAWTGSGTILAAAEDAAGSGPVIVAIDAGGEGMTAETQRLTDGTTSATLVFDDLLVPAGGVLLRGEPARAALELALARGTLSLCAQLEGLAGGLWEITADYLRQRIQFEKPIADFQAVRHAMVDLHTQIELAAASWRRGLSALESGRISDPAVHAAKARCSDAAMAMAKRAVQYHGAFGYTVEADVGLYLNTALRWASWLGNAPAHRKQAFDLQQLRNDR